MLLIEALTMFETMSFATSFLSSNCTMPLYAIYLVWLVCQQEFRMREGAMVVLMNLFFLSTYPEFLVIAKGFEVLAIGVALWRGNRPHWLPLLAANAVIAVMHPLLLLAKFQALTNQLATTAGWNVIGDPVKDTVGFSFPRHCT
jgi:hypothetical protein